MMLADAYVGIPLLDLHRAWREPVDQVVQVVLADQGVVVHAVELLEPGPVYHRPDHDRSVDPLVPRRPIEYGKPVSRASHEDDLARNGETALDHGVDYQVHTPLPHLETVDARLQPAGQLAQAVEEMPVHQEYLRARRRQEVEPVRHHIRLFEDVHGVFDRIPGLRGNDAERRVIGNVLIGAEVARNVLPVCLDHHRRPERRNILLGIHARHGTGGAAGTQGGPVSQSPPPGERYREGVPRFRNPSITPSPLRERAGVRVMTQVFRVREL